MVQHQDIIYCLLIHVGHPEIECTSLTSSGYRNYYSEVFGSKANVTVAVTNENLCNEFLSALYILSVNIEEIQIS